MISHLTGTILLKTERHLILDVGGVGYKVAATTETLGKSKAEETVSLWTHLAVRENALDLYGFLTKEEQNFFELLITVSGIGPKSALAIFNVASVETLRRAISSGDTSYLTKVSGIGRKTAEKIVLELREKIGAQGDSEKGSSAQNEVDAVEALKSLGYSQFEAREAVKKIEPSITDTGARVKAALKQLAKPKS